MSRNYTAIHYIQNHLKNFNQDFVNCVVRCFNRIDQTKESDGCLSNTVALYVCAKEFGYNPKICYGLCSLSGLDFYHAWLEIDETIIDLSIYGNVNFSLFSLWSFQLDCPYIGAYESPDIDVSYGKFIFDDDWPYSLLSKIEGMSLLRYINNAPQNSMWKLIFKLLDKTSTMDLANHLKTLIEGVELKPI